MKSISLLTVVRYIAVVGLLCVAAFPVYWMFVTSLTPSEALFAGPSFLPRLSEFGATYIEALHAIPISTWLLNSLIVAVGTTVLSIAISLYPAYALSRFRFRGKGLAGIALFATQMLPEAMLVVPLYAIFGQFRLLNSLTGLIFVNAAFSVPVIIWIIRGDRRRADRNRGGGARRRLLAGRHRAAHRAAAHRSHLGGSRGDRLLPRLEQYVFAQTLVSSESLRTASVGLAGFVGELSTPIHSVMAVSVIYTAPAILFYLFVQRFVVAGMTAGSVKG